MTPQAPGMGLFVWALGLTQIIGYGTLYYSFGSLAPEMGADFGWSVEWIYAVLSGSLLVGGLIAPLSGRLADRYGAALVMTAGSVAAAAALVLAALAPNGLSFIAGLVAIEVASTFVFYATAFAALAQVAPHGAQRAITQLTLIAGFASTVFWPLTTWLQEGLGWRDIYLLYAALNLTVCLPVHGWLAVSSKRRRAAHGGRGPGPLEPLVPEHRRGLGMLLMLAALALLGFVSSAVTIHMVPMLAALGLGGAGVVVTTLFGPAQVLSRLVNMQFGRGLSQPMLALIAAAMLPLGLATLVFTAPSVVGAAAFAILFGVGNGLSSIVSGTLPLVLFGASGYGQRLGWISSARLVAAALAPFIFVAIAAAWSTAAAVLATALVGVAAALVFGGLWWAFGRSTPQTEVART
jgi:MFS family permease